MFINIKLHNKKNKKPLASVFRSLRELVHEFKLHLLRSHGYPIKALQSSSFFLSLLKCITILDINFSFELLGHQVCLETKQLKITNFF
jgi:hypothetical protein